MIRSAGIPARISLLIIPWTWWAASLMPFSSSLPPTSKLRMSNHDGIWKPRFNVTGIVAAVGQLNCMNGGLQRRNLLITPNPVNWVFNVYLPYLVNQRAPAVTCVAQSMQEDNRCGGLAIPVIKRAITIGISNSHVHLLKISYRFTYFATPTTSADFLM